MSDVPNPPAFPRPSGGAEGMTLRDYFAANAMIALHARATGTPPDCRKESLLADADVFYPMADAMLAVRAKDTAAG